MGDRVSVGVNRRRNEEVQGCESGGRHVMERTNGGVVAGVNEGVGVEVN